MSTASSIEWTEATWNPTTGCDRISPGCDHCYALTLAKRLKAMGSAKYQHDGDSRTSGPGFGVAFYEAALTEPLRWATPRRVFVNSMSDLAHARVSDAEIARVFAVMAASRQHTFQVLTKRPKRLRTLLSSPTFHNLVEAAGADLAAHPQIMLGRRQEWPLPNVWVGTSIESDHYCWRAEGFALSAGGDLAADGRSTRRRRSTNHASTWSPTTTHRPVSIWPNRPR